jgi:hypothetical protein
MDEHVVDAMFRAGVPMMAGTDAMNHCFPGFGLRDELALLVESGALRHWLLFNWRPLILQSSMGRTGDLGSRECGCGEVFRRRCAGAILEDARDKARH